MKKQLFLLIAALLLVVIPTSVYLVGAQQSEREPLPASAPYNVAPEERVLSDLYNSVIQSVVNINVAVGSQGLGNGSGFVIDTQGHIVTNNHVVEQASYLQVTFHDGQAVEAQVVGTDPDSDLAVIKIDPAGLNLQPVQLADSDQVIVGQGVIALGSPFGQDFTLTTGIVSALSRQIDATSNFVIPDVIQTDAAINPGNSGGPLLDMEGHVIGVNSAILTRTGAGSGVGFAIPSNQVRRVVPYLIAEGRYEHSWLGISGSSLSAEQRETENLPQDLVGVMVANVNPAGPGDGAGLRGSEEVINTPLGRQTVGGDIITAINGSPISQMADLIAFLNRETRPGETVTLTVYRDGQFVDLSVALAERPDLDVAQP